MLLSIYLFRILFIVFHLSIFNRQWEFCDCSFIRGPIPIYHILFFVAVFHSYHAWRCIDPCSMLTFIVTLFHMNGNLTKNSKHALTISILLTLNRTQYFRFFHLTHILSKGKSILFYCYSIFKYFYDASSTVNWIKWKRIEVNTRKWRKKLKAIHVPKSMQDEDNNRPHE